MNSLQPLKDAIRHPFAWPGGYTKAIYMADGERLCVSCARKEFRLIAEATRDGYERDWVFLAVDVYWEGPDETCVHCDKDLPSEYGDPDA